MVQPDYLIEDPQVKSFRSLLFALPALGQQRVPERLAWRPPNTASYRAWEKGAGAGGPTGIVKFQGEVVPIYPPATGSV